MQFQNTSSGPFLSFHNPPGFFTVALESRGVQHFYTSVALGSKFWKASGLGHGLIRVLDELAVGLEKIMHVNAHLSQGEGTGVRHAGVKCAD